MATYEMNTFKTDYQKQVRNNAKAFARALNDAGIDVEGDRADGFTETHQVVIRVSRHGAGNDLAQRLEENNIITNYQALPDDESFLQASGIRMGVQEMTRFGMKEDDFKTLANYVADVIANNATVREKVADLRQKFLTMQYCLSPNQAAPIAARVFSTVFSNKDFVKAILANLEQLAL
jgi:glycine/serine hydroxymethyltransferase